MANANNTKESIVSRAFIMLGEAPIATFTEGGTPALVASNIYDSLYEDALTAHRWLFASKKVVLSRLANRPIGDNWEYGFKIPSDELRIVTVESGREGEREGADFEVNGDVIYSNTRELILEYIYKPEEQFLPPYFVKYLEFKCAAEMGVAIVHSDNRAKYFADLSETQLRRARSIDNQSAPQGGWNFQGFRRGQDYNSPYNY